MLYNIIKKGVNNYLNYKSFKTKRNLIVIESDDWGSLRTQDNKTLNYLNKISKMVQQDPYIQFDSIATADDLSALFEVLSSVKDSKGNSACITANICTANPDFDKIKSCNFSKFHFESFTKTLEKYSYEEDLLNIWKSGKQEKIFYPQLHGREHIHALAWLAELNAGNKDLIRAFELNSCSIPYKGINFQKRQNFQAALDRYNLKGEILFQKEWIKDCAEIFKNTFGYYSNSFIAPAYVWHKDIHSDLANCNIKTLQGIKLQYEPCNTFNKKYKRKLHFNGELDNKSDLIYTVRNVFFEPSIIEKKEWVNSTLIGIEKAFQNYNPAIIGSHRINYIGRLNEQNRINNLSMLKSILKNIVHRFPNVEFINSSQLAEIMLSNNK